ncbi:hypothetical protein GH880_28340 [Bacillus thuringiensis]|nr:hypothetical protein [Bacillus thuringiensis]
MENQVKFKKVNKVNSPIEILTDLGVLKTNKKGKIKGVYKDQLIEEMSTRKAAFDWIHLGVTDVTIENFHRVLENNPHLVPPRTGHMGNWSDIANGRAGMIDYNKTVTADLKRGYPLIYSNNQTEDTQMENGDWIYLPGSLIESGNRKLLKLYTWDGKQFVERSRENSLFTPFVLTSLDGELLPLTKFHWDKMTKYNHLDFVMFDSVVIQNWKLVSDMLRTLVKTSIDNPTINIELKDIFAHEVSLDGTIQRSNIEFDGSGFKVGDTYFDNISELVEASMLPLLAVAEPDSFFDNMSSWPKKVPVISKMITTMLFSILNAHYRNCQIDRETMCQPFNPHFHWGALSLAGYPPFVKGTFSNRTNLKKISDMQQVILQNFPEIDPTFFVLLPVAPFTLYPTSVNPQDFEPLERLAYKVQESTRGLENKPNIMMKEVGGIVENWIFENESKLSNYFLNKFSKRRSVLNEIDLPEYSEYVELPAFKTLTFKQGCIITGHLLNQLGK